MIFRGISLMIFLQKIKDQDNTNTIYLDYISARQTGREVNSRPKFVASIKGHKIDFYLSTLNYLSNSNGQILILTISIPAPI